MGLRRRTRRCRAQMRQPQFCARRRRNHAPLPRGRTPRDLSGNSSGLGRSATRLEEAQDLLRLSGTARSCSARASGARGGEEEEDDRDAPPKVGELVDVIADDGASLCLEAATVPASTRRGSTTSCSASPWRRRARPSRASRGAWRRAPRRRRSAARLTGRLEGRRISFLGEQLVMRTSAIWRTRRALRGFREGQHATSSDDGTRVACRARTTPAPRSAAATPSPQRYGGRRHVHVPALIAPSASVEAPTTRAILPRALRGRGRRWWLGSASSGARAIAVDRRARLRYRAATARRRPSSCRRRAGVRIQPRTCPRAGTIPTWSRRSTSPSWLSKPSAIRPAQYFE